MEEYAQSFPLKLNSNYSPSDPEVAQIRKLLREQVAELTDVERCISDVCDDLLQKKAAIKDHIEGLKTLLSPARRLSYGILQRVFHFCIPNDQNAVMSSKEAPLLLGRVCRTWRDISIATPQLWTTVHIPILYRQHPPLANVESENLSNHRSEAVKRWLDRSGTLPLSISVVEVRIGDGADVPNDPGASLFRTLVQFSKQWRKVELTCASSLLHIRHLIDEDVPVLESLSIRTPFDLSLGNNNVAAGLLLFSAPPLRTVRLSNLSGYIFHYPIAWWKITELHIDRHGGGVAHPISSTVALLLLQRCPRLVRCRLEIHGRDDSQVTGEVTLPFLTELWVTESAGALVQFYMSLNTPALRQFKLASNQAPTNNKFPPAELLSRCFELDTLILNPARLNQMHIAECLLNTPSITTLILQSDDVNRMFLTYGPNNTLAMMEHAVDDFIIGLLTPSESSPVAVAIGELCLCPRLQNFQCRHNAISDEILLHFIKSRTGPYTEKIACLKSVNISLFPRTWTIDIVQHLSAEIADGLKVSLGYSQVTPVAPSAGMCWNDEEED